MDPLSGSAVSMLRRKKHPMLCSAPTAPGLPWEVFSVVFSAWMPTSPWASWAMVATGSWWCNKTKHTLRADYLGKTICVLEEDTKVSKVLFPLIELKENR